MYLSIRGYIKLISGDSGAGGLTKHKVILKEYYYLTVLPNYQRSNVSEING